MDRIFAPYRPVYHAQEAISPVEENNPAERHTQAVSGLFTDLVMSELKSENQASLLTFLILSSTMFPKNYSLNIIKVTWKKGIS